MPLSSSFAGTSRPSISSAWSGETSRSRQGSPSPNAPARNRTGAAHSGRGCAAKSSRRCPTHRGLHARPGLRIGDRGCRRVIGILRVAAEIGELVDGQSATRDGQRPRRGIRCAWHVADGERAGTRPGLLLQIDVIPGTESLDRMRRRSTKTGLTQIDAARCPRDKDERGRWIAVKFRYGVRAVQGDVAAAGTPPSRSARRSHRPGSRQPSQACRRSAYRRCRSQRPGLRSVH
jgi:hypothetical protein